LGRVTRCETCREPPSGERAAGILIAAAAAAAELVVAGTNSGGEGEGERARL